MVNPVLVIHIVRHVIIGECASYNVNPLFSLYIWGRNGAQQEATTSVVAICSYRVELFKGS